MDGWTGHCGYSLGPLPFWFVHRDLKTEIESFRVGNEPLHRTGHRTEEMMQRMDYNTSKVQHGQDALCFEAWTTSLDSFELMALSGSLDGSKFLERMFSRYFIHIFQRLSGIRGCIMLHNSNGEHCGMLYGLEAQENRQGRDQELVLLSRTQLPWCEGLEPGEDDKLEEALDSLPFDHAKFQPTEWCLMNVMLVEWTDGRAERLTIGYIHETAWLNAKVIKKQIELY